MGYAKKVLEERFLAIDVRHVPCRLVMHQAEITRVTGVAAAQAGRRLFNQAYRGAAAPRCDRCAQGGAATADYQNVDSLRGGGLAHDRVRSILFRTTFPVHR